MCWWYHGMWMDVSIYTTNIYTLILIFVSIIVLRNLMFFDFVNNLNHFNLNIINEDCCLKKKILLLNVCNAIYLLIFLKFNVFRSQFLLIFWWFYNNIYTCSVIHIYCSKKKSEHNYYYYVAVLWFLYRYIDFVLFCLVQEKEKIDLYQFFYFYFFFCKIIKSSSICVIFIYIYIFCNK